MSDGINPWLITWEFADKAMGKTIPNLIAAILPIQTSKETIKLVMELLHSNYSACPGNSESLYVAEQERFARKKYSYKATLDSDGWPVMRCGGNPWLHARRVTCLEISTDAEGYDSLTWFDYVIPTLTEEQRSSGDLGDVIPLKQKPMHFSAKTNIITAGESFKPNKGIKPPRKRKPKPVDDE